MYSLTGKKVCFIELTCPQEEYMSYWRKEKLMRYQKLVEQAQSNGFSAICLTVEVGARGYVAKHSMRVFTMLGIDFKTKDTIRRELSKTSLKCSHFIWIHREDKKWSNPARLCQ